MITVWILGDQLLDHHPALARAQSAGVAPEEIVVLLIERTRLPYRYHAQKLVFVWSAMRHYAAELAERGFRVDCRSADTLTDGVAAHIAAFAPDRIITMAASSYSGRRQQTDVLPARLAIPVEVVPNTQFLVERFNPIPKPEPGKRYVLEHFYRDMRRHFDVLMDGDDPAGGEWNFDHANRESLGRGVALPEPIGFEPDATTQAVIEAVGRRDDTVGRLRPFRWAVTRADALTALDRFIAERLPDFGRYEDAMTTRSATVFHSTLSPYLNFGLLEPLMVIRRVADAFRAGRVPINSAEGFIRQVLGWREFMYWQYWRQMPGMTRQNAWGHTRPLPEFFWSGATRMRCMAHVLGRVQATGYAHHIERLMVLAGFAFMAGVDPAAVNDWFMGHFIDATAWVMPPNVIGMSLNADGGLTATKPYFSSANYINKMSDYCRGCAYDRRARTGDNACPFNTLYWNFVLENEAELRANARTARLTWGLRHLDEAERPTVRAKAARLLADMSEV